MPAGSSIPTERNDGREENPSEEMDWTAESEPVLDEDVDETQPEKPQPAPATAKPAAAKPGEPQAKPGEPKPGEGEQPQPKPGEGEQPKPQPQPQKQETPEEKAAREQQEQQAAQKYTEELEKYYALPEDLAARLATEPEKVLPTLAARVHQAVERGMRQYMAQAVPQFLQQYQAVTEANTKAKEAFYGRWPSLKNYEKQVQEVGAMFRQMNPKATPEDAIERIGATVCAAMGITPDAKPGGAPNLPARPTSSARPAPARPAGVGSSQAGAQPATENEWSQMAEQLLDEDRAAG